MLLFLHLASTASASNFSCSYHGSSLKPTIKVSIDGGVYLLVIDTGNTNTSLKPSSFDRLIETHLNSTVDKVFVNSVSINGYIVSTNQYISRLEREELRNYDGVLGNDVLGKLSFGMDYQNKLIHFWTKTMLRSDIKRFFGSTDNINIVTLHRQLGVYFVAVLAKKTRFFACLDTGAPESILPLRIANIIGASTTNTKMSFSTDWGKFIGYSSEVNHLLLDRTKIYSFTFYIIVQQDDFPFGIIGLSVFKDTKFIFDAKNCKIYVQGFRRKNNISKLSVEITGRYVKNKTAVSVSYDDTVVYYLPYGGKYSPNVTKSMLKSNQFALTPEGGIVYVVLCRISGQ